MAAYLMLPEPEDRVATLGALLEEAIKQSPKGEHHRVARYVADMMLKTFPEPKGKATAGLTPEAPIH